jgi:polyhydroxybutyrate depolymerase
VVPISGGNRVADCKPSRPIPVINVRGRTDNLVPFGGNNTWPSAMADFTKWSEIDGCTDTPVAVPMHPACQMRTKCAGGVEVLLCSIDGGHVLYGDAARQMSAIPDVAWELFQRHPLP